ncbi:MAG: Ca2+-dependent phosphoinositide-specific phospholipase C [Paraglaciecola sp.]|uniref:Ca2+-dependent phosphoinositide-specific phospholipase C n=1 Tax=Paraglaciecola sp. TaxID=1920173 RepID=UPI003264A705
MSRSFFVVMGMLFMLITACSFPNTNPKLNHIQMVGSHNSYKGPLDPKIKALVAEKDAAAVAKIDYSHPPFITQLAMGMRHFEIDIVKDPQGGKFAKPLGERLTNQHILSERQLTELKKPGFKVMHIPDIDFISHCILFEGCLNALLHFSNSNPRHLPIVILMNFKGNGNRFINGTPVLPFNRNDYEEVDNILFETFGDKLITPDEVRGDHKTLEEGALNGGWPLLEVARGRFLFILDGKPEERETYREHHPSLSGRALFSSYLPGEAEAAFMVRNNAIKQFDEIKELVKLGYMVRTRADSGQGSDSKIDDVKVRTKSAIDSGAQIISTDFYPSAPQKLSDDFSVSFKGHKLNRCNPLFLETYCLL